MRLAGLVIALACAASLGCTLERAILLPESYFDAFVPDAGTLDHDGSVDEAIDASCSAEQCCPPRGPMEVSNAGRCDPFTPRCGGSGQARPRAIRARRRRLTAR